MLGQAVAQRGERQILIEPVVAADLAHRHHLDQRHLEASAGAPPHQIGDLVVVDAAKRHDVDLDPQTGSDRGIDPGAHPGQIADAGDRPETRLVQACPAKC